MPHQVLFIQGGGEGTHDAWDDKLVASLRKALGAGYSVHYPRMPDQDRPDAAAWKKEIAGALAKLVMPGRQGGGVIITMLLGMAGALVAGALGHAVGWYRTGDEGPGILAATVGFGALIAVGVSS